MDKRDFFERFIRLLSMTKERYELENKHDALIVWFGEYYLSLDPDEVKDRIVRDSHAEGVDAILIDQRNFRLFFIQAKTVNNYDYTKKNFPENDIKLTLDGIRFLIRGDYKGRITPGLNNLVDEYHDLANTGDYQSVVVFLTLKSQPMDTKFIDHFRKDFAPIKVDFWDIDQIFNFYVDKYLSLKEPAPKRISFEVKSNILKKTEPYESRVFSCKGKDLARLYDEYKEIIFQQNVRYSLGMRSRSINQIIYETAKDDNRSTEFWYFNNGITIICKKILDTPAEKVINLVEPQIINGAQTTYALHEAYKEGILSDDIEVLIKVIETKDSGFIENVTLYTNSQNPIRLRDLCSNDVIQINIQRILLGSYRYFYERKRGELDSIYKNRIAKERLLGDNYEERIIINEKASQAYLAFYLDKPAQAKSERGRIFLKESSGFYEQIFNSKDELLPEKMLMSWKLLNYIEMQKKDYSKKYRRIENHRKADSLSDSEKKEIYDYDFLLHSEYFILNIFKDFLKNKGYDILENRTDLSEIIKKIDSNDRIITEIYSIIIKKLSSLIKIRKLEPGYYHNKFFKYEGSIGIVRDKFHKEFYFIEVI